MLVCMQNENPLGWHNMATSTCPLCIENCQRDLIGNDCRCPACEERRVEAAEYAQEASEGR